ncbi:unnamed protein product [Mytilus coruscus]|uniref:Uncharacterized protein n=1 Tax=Mytilus coruscus TaxID=42192 RepID=A0A6J8DSF9_MYTCO|nr:unnamed protein product [Mytilus coruscus]
MKNVNFNFYVENSTQIIQISTANRDGQKKINLNSPTARLYNEYDGMCNVALSTFRKMKSKNALTVDKHRLNSCLCGICLNVSNKIYELFYKLRNPQLQSDKYQVCSDTLCSRQEGQQFHNAECIERTCSKCVIDRLHNVYSHLVEMKGEDSIKWNK